MRWFFTNQHPLAEAVAGAGEQIVSGPGQYQIDSFPWLRAACAGDESSEHITATLARLRAERDVDLEDANPLHYQVRRYLDATEADVLVATPLLQPGFGLPKAHVLRWYQAAVRPRRRLVVALVDAATLRAATQSWRGCSLNTHNIHVVVTSSPASAAQSARERRTALWSPGDDPAPVLAAVKHAMSGKCYMAGRQALPFQ